jgi:hypothetical protein
MGENQHVYCLASSFSDLRGPPEAAFFYDRDRICLSVVAVNSTAQSKARRGVTEHRVVARLKAKALKGFYGD